MEKKAEILMSSDSFSGYGLDLVFDVSKEAWFDGIDLAMWKSLDSWNTEYVKKLSKKHEMPVRVIQTSSAVNAKELNQALDLCEATWATTITINAPKITDFKAYNFILDNLENYKKNNKWIKFSIINPESWNLFALPVSKYRFTNVVEIIKKYWCYLWLDIVNLDENTLENEFMRKIEQFIPYISVLYFSDKTSIGERHVIPWEWSLKLDKLLKKLKQNRFLNYFSTKVDLPKNELADSEKIILILKKIRKYYQENYEDINLEE